MPDTAHLPQAVRYGSKNDLADLDDLHLLLLLEECDVWLARADEFASNLSTPSARTLWKALARADIERVENTRGSLRAEVSRRGL